MLIHSGSLRHEAINYCNKITHNTAILLILVSFILYPIIATATAYSIPKNGSRLIGTHESYIVKSGDYFHSIASSYNIGLLALMKSNPNVDPLLPPVGTKLVIPINMLLPDVPHQGIVINLPEFRMYYFPQGTNEVHVFPIGIGRVGRPTPTMQSTIMSKIKNPSWTPNARLRADHLKKYGKELPSTIPPGKDNPLGNYALQLAFGSNNYWIHGTNQNFGIGMRISAGCVRMNPDDIEWLFEQVQKGERVQIINQPIKISVEANGQKIVEIHPPLDVNETQSNLTLNNLDKLTEFKKQYRIDKSELQRALLQHQGIPVNIDI